MRHGLGLYQCRSCGDSPPVVVHAGRAEHAESLFGAIDPKEQLCPVCFAWFCGTFKFYETLTKLRRLWPDERI